MKIAMHQAIDIWFRVALLVLEETHNYHGICETTQKDVGKIGHDQATSKTTSDMHHIYNSWNVM